MSDRTFNPWKWFIPTAVGTVLGIYAYDLALDQGMTIIQRPSGWEPYVLLTIAVVLILYGQLEIRRRSPKTNNSEAEDA